MLNHHEIINSRIHYIFLLYSPHMQETCEVNSSYTIAEQIIKNLLSYHQDLYEAILPKVDKSVIRVWRIGNAR